MATLFTTIDSGAVAAGADLTFNTLFSFMGNDWSLVSGGTQDVLLPPDTVASATTPTWTNMQTFWIQLPSFSIDSTYDTLELAVVMRVQAYASASPDCSIRLTNSGATITSSAVTVTDTSYAMQEYMTLVFPQASVPSGEVELKIQGKWDSDPGSETLYTRRVLGGGQGGDVEIYVRRT